MVLDQLFEVDAAHAYKNNHLVATFTSAEFLKLKEESLLLEQKVEGMMSRGYCELSIGQTVQESFDNYAFYDKARQIGWKVYDLVSYAKVEVFYLDPLESNKVFARKADSLPFPFRLDFKEHVNLLGLQSYLLDQDHD